METKKNRLFEANLVVLSLSKLNLSQYERTCDITL